MSFLGGNKKIIIMRILMADVELFMVELSSNYGTLINSNFVNFPPTTGSVRMAGCYGQLEREEKGRKFSEFQSQMSYLYLTLHLSLCPASSAKQEEGNY